MEEARQGGGHQAMKPVHRFEPGGYRFLEGGFPFCQGVAAEPGFAGLGFNWFHVRPPIVELDFEMDMRGVRTEIVIG